MAPIKLDFILQSKEEQHARMELTTALANDQEKPSVFIHSYQ
jgi:hypothetical protein